jgi:DNA-binding NtrC family response regulator
MQRILIVDDERNMRRVLEMLFQSHGYSTMTAADGEDAVEILNRGESVDLVISDLRMPGLDGKGLLRHIKEKDLRIPLILITAYGTVEEAVQCMKYGAADFITKPFNQEVVLHVVGRHFTTQALELQNAILKDTCSQNNLVYRSREMRGVMDTVERLAHVGAPVLITGESGSGKEMIARAIHAYHPERPFVKINCPAIPDTLFESELFGHQKGAFTGATASFAGRVKMADGGTLFLDEIADIPRQIQPKLLRLLEEKCFEPLGSNTTIRMNARVLCATNRDLEELVERYEFRKDLFYRMNTVTINLPPLRERRDDIEPLSDYYLAKLTTELARGKMSLSREALQAFTAYSWPGNVRELRNVIERAVILATGDTINLADVIVGLGNGRLEAGAGESSTLDAQERRLLLESLRKHNSNVSAAARELGTSRDTLRYRMKKHGIELG